MQKALFIYIYYIIYVIGRVSIRNSGLRFTYGNDPDIFSISIMEKVLVIWNTGTKSGNFFSCKPEFSGMWRNIISESFQKKFYSLVKNISVNCDKRTWGGIILVPHLSLIAPPPPSTIKC